MKRRAESRQTMWYTLTCLDKALVFRKIDAANSVPFPFQLYEFVLLWSRQR